MKGGELIETYPDNCSRPCSARSPLYNRTRTFRRVTHNKAARRDWPGRIVLEGRRIRRGSEERQWNSYVSFMFHIKVPAI